MPRKRYSAQTKTAIVEAVKTARNAKKSWAEACVAAQKAGYKGSLGGLEQMIRRADVKTSKHSARKVALKSIGKRGPGRPRIAAGTGGGVSSIEALVNQVVRERVAGPLERAIAVLQSC